MHIFFIYLSRLYVFLASARTSTSSSNHPEAAQVWAPRFQSWAPPSAPVGSEMSHQHRKRKAALPWRRAHPTNSPNDHFSNQPTNQQTKQPTNKPPVWDKTCDILLWILPAAWGWHLPIVTNRSCKPQTQNQRNWVTKKNKRMPPKAAELQRPTAHSCCRALPSDLLGPSQSSRWSLKQSLPPTSAGWRPSSGRFQVPVVPRQPPAHHWSCQMQVGPMDLSNLTIHAARGHLEVAKAALSLLPRPDARPEACWDLCYGSIVQRSSQRRPQALWVPAVPAWSHAKLAAHFCTSPRHQPCPARSRYRGHPLHLHRPTSSLRSPAPPPPAGKWCQQPSQASLQSHHGACRSSRPPGHPSTTGFPPCPSSSVLPKTLRGLLYKAGLEPWRAVADRLGRRGCRWF